MPAWMEAEEPKPLSEKGRRSSSGAGFFGVLAKSAKILKAVKAVKLLQPLVSFGSMVASVFAYSFALGWLFSIGFVLMLFVHEMGHAVALKSRGMKASFPVFIPFLGAAIFAPDFGDRHDEARMAFAGPLIGSLGAALVFVAALVTPGNHPLLLGIANTALLINLFNLIPISPLDGGRVTQAIGPAFKYVGVLALLALTLYLQTAGLIVIWVLVLMDLRISYKRRFLAGILLETMAAVMMLLQVGHPQPFWVNAIDLAAMSLINAIFLWDWRKGHGISQSRPDNRPQLTASQRWKWFATYAALTAALFAMSIIVHGKLAVYIAG